jgi:small subunit ribosomal protein S16
LLRIRLRRAGKKKQPAYRIVVADSRAPRDGDFVETLGHYHPLNEPSVIVLDADRARHWLERGAQPSDRVWKIFAIQGIADIPPKLQTRIELGRQRAEEAKKAKPKEETPPTTQAPAAQAAPAIEVGPVAADDATQPEPPPAEPDLAPTEPQAAAGEKSLAEPSTEAPADAEPQPEAETPQG